MRKHILLVVMVILACAGPFRRGYFKGDGPLPIQTILAGSYSLADTFSVALITNDRQWEQTWLVAKGRVDPLPEKPTVDFDRQYVIAAFMGQRPSSGYRIEISSVVKQGGTLKVYVTNYETPGMLTVITSPFYLARIPRGNYRIEVLKSVVQ
jgi:hypothetical protein